MRSHTGRLSPPGDYAFYQHEAHLRLRAIENRVGIVRAANTGISEYLDPLGRPHGATELMERAQRIYEAETTTEYPLSVRWGDWIGTTCLVLTLGCLGWYVVGRWRARRSS